MKHARNTLSCRNWTALPAVLLLAALVAAVPALPARAQAGALPDEEKATVDPVEVNKKAARLFVEDVYNDRNLEAIPLYVDPEFHDHSPGAPPHAEGPDFVREQAEFTLSAFPDLEFEILRLVGEGDKVAIHWKMTGTSSGVLGGPGSRGREVEIQGISLFRYEDGFVVESWDLVDRAALMEQLGFTLEPPPEPEEESLEEGPFPNTDEP